MPLELVEQIEYLSDLIVLLCFNFLLLIFLFVERIEAQLLLVIVGLSFGNVTLVFLTKYQSDSFIDLVNFVALIELFVDDVVNDVIECLQIS